MIAEHGVDVPLREVAAAGGQRNNSAVQYHFGTRDSLIQAVIEYRMTALEQIRVAMLADLEGAAEPADVADLVGVLVRPLLDVPYREGATHYARFLEQVRNLPGAIDPTNLSNRNWAAVRIVTRRLERVLADMTPTARRKRLVSMTTAMFALIADYERTITADADDGDDRSAAADDIIDMLTGLLTAPRRAAAAL
jgi:AcrR family transcriptional regulator